KNAASPDRLTPVGGPQDVDQVTAATGSRVLRFPSLNGRFHFSIVQLQRSAPRGHKSLRLCGCRDAAQPKCFMPVGPTRSLPLFFSLRKIFAKLRTSTTGGTTYEARIYWNWCYGQ